MQPVIAILPPPANAVEQSARTVSATGHLLRTIQTIDENAYAWLVGPLHFVSERKGAD